MITPRLSGLIIAACFAAVTAFGADPAGAWKWSVATPNGDLETTLKLTFNDGKLAGTYSNSFGEASISNATFQNDAIAFDVQREFDGNKFLLKYRGKLDGDTIKGTIEVPGMDGGEPRKIDWNAKRVGEAAPAPAR